MESLFPQHSCGEQFQKTRSLDRSTPPSSSTRCLTSSQVPVLPEPLGAATNKREYNLQDVKNPASISAEGQGTYKGETCAHLRFHSNTELPSPEV